MSDPWTMEYLEEMKEQNTRLRVLNAQLLEALKEIASAKWLSPINRALEAIALAEKETFETTP